MAQLGRVYLAGSVRAETVGGVKKGGEKEEKVCPILFLLFVCEVK